MTAGHDSDSGQWFDKATKAGKMVEKMTGAI